MHIDPIKQSTNYQLPTRRSEFNASDLDSRVFRIHSIRRDPRTPPRGEVGTGEIQGKEDEDGAESQTDIQTRGKNVVILHPPTSPAIADPLVEDKADDAPSDVVERSSRGDETGSAKDDRRGEIADGRFGEHAGADVDQDGEGGTDEPEPHERGVHLADGEDASRADDAPDDGGVEEDAPVGTVEVVFLVQVADVLDCAESPVHDGDLD